MMKISNSLAWIAAMVMVVASACDAPERSSQSVLDSLAMKHPCSGSAPLVDRVAEELSSEQACVLITFALHELGESDSALTGIPTADLAEVRTTSVDIISQQDESGRPIESWWVVTLRIPSKPYNGEVRVSTRDGATALRRVHKPHGS